MEDKPPDPEVREYRFIVGQDEAKQRLDVYLQEKIAELSRTRIHDLIDSYLVKVNNTVVKPSHRTRPGDRIHVTVPPPVPTVIEPEPYPLKILFEDDDMIVINKDPGISVHPTVGNFHHTLVNYALYHCKNLSGIAGELRPGVVHRLDKPTSGIIVMAKNDLAHAGLAAQFKQRLTEKYYYAIVKNPMEFNEGYIRKSIIRDPRDRQRMAATDDLTMGKSALTTYEVVDSFPTASLMRIRIHTGRTHQIRVHFASIGHPLIGDTLYQRRLRPIDRYGLALVSKELKISHPRTGQEMYFTVPFPEHFDAIIRLLKNNDPRELVEEDYDAKIEEAHAEDETDVNEDVN